MGAETRIMGEVREMIRRIGCLALAALAWGAPVTGQDEVPAEAVARVAAADAAIDGIARRDAAALWPTFRPDTIPIVYSFPDRGWVLANWEGDTLPAGFRTVPDHPGIAWRPVVEDAPPQANMVSLGERKWAFVPAVGLDLPALVGLAAHEAFHVWEGVARNEGRFPPGENAFLVTEYPEFDVENEAGVALEGRLLAAALSATDPAERRERIRELVAARESRHRSLGAELAAFETAAEHNEGVAQYVYHRAVELAAEAGDLDRSAARESVERELARLETMVGEQRYSLRRRFYTTGTAMGRLLDEIAGPEWKTRTMESGLALHELLAEATGYREREERFVARSMERHGEVVEETAERAVEERQARRGERVEEALAAPGIRVEMVSAGSLPMCGIDPQNLLQTGDGRLLHTRWLKLCPPGGEIEFRTPVVHDRVGHVLRAVIGSEEEIDLEIKGMPFPLDALPTGVVDDLEIRSDGLVLALDGATVERDGEVLRIELGD